MDPISLAAGNYLVSLGLPGIGILYLMYALRAEKIAHKATREKLDQVQDQRVLDATAQTKAIEFNSSATAAGTRATETMARALENLTNTILSTRGHQT
jgi:hypothetical protein